MNWEVYEKKIRKEAKKSLYPFTFDELLSDGIMPPLTKASSYLLKDAVKGGAKRLIMVLPENQDLACTLLLEKLLSDISDGTISSDYDLAKFEVGEKVSIGDAIVEYRGTYFNSEQEQDFIELKMFGDKFPMTVKAPLSMIPVMQHIKTNKKLSKYAVYLEELKKVAPDADHGLGGPLEKLSLVRTHLSATTLFVSFSKRTRDLVIKSSVNDVSISDVINLAQVDLEGDIKPIGDSKMSGIPGLLLASDLYSASMVADKNIPINSIAIVVEKVSAIEKELDSLDELLELDIPVTVIVSCANSLGLDELLKRDFMIWRWDQKWLTPNLVGPYESQYKDCINNIQNRTITYEVLTEDLVSETISLIVKNRSLAETQVSSINSLFDKLFDLSFQTVRTIVPVDEVQKESIREQLEELKNELDRVKNDLPESEYIDFKKSISNLKTIFKANSVLPKVVKLEELLMNAVDPSVVLVFPSSNYFNIDGIQSYWRSWLKTHSINTTLDVYTFADYYELAPLENAVTIICGWFNADRMKRLLFANKTAEYTVLLYEFEAIWSANRQARWNWEIGNNNNAEICAKYLHLEIEEHEDASLVIDFPEADTPEDIDELEKYVSTIKYKKYLHSASVQGNELVSVIPVFFTNGTFMFMRLGQEVISVTRMLLHGWDDIEKRDSTDLSVGDYIVFRESGKDLIREVADSLLSKSGESDAREMSSRWRQALELEMMFSSEDEIYQKMKQLGWSKTRDTLQRWITDESLIAPQTKRDIEILAKATDNAVTGEMVDDIYQASRVVKNAHITAGRLLSNRLSNELGHYIKEMAVNADECWKSLDIDIEDVGNAKIMKIENIGEQAQVENSYVGRLMQD